MAADTLTVVDNRTGKMPIDRRGEAGGHRRGMAYRSSRSVGSKLSQGRTLSHRDRINDVRRLGEKPCGSGDEQCCWAR